MPLSNGQLSYMLTYMYTKLQLAKWPPHAFLFILFGAPYMEVGKGLLVKLEVLQVSYDLCFWTSVGRCLWLSHSNYENVPFSRPNGVSESMTLLDYWGFNVVLEIERRNCYIGSNFWFYTWPIFINITFREVATKG